MHSGPSGTTWTTSDSPDGLCARSAPPSSGGASQGDAAAAPTVDVSMSGVMSAAVAGSPSLDGEEAGLDMSDFEELLDHLKTSEYMPGDFVFRYHPAVRAQANTCRYNFVLLMSYSSILAPAHESLRPFWRCLWCLFFCSAAVVEALGRFLNGKQSQGYCCSFHLKKKYDSF